ncbi:MAG: LuxR C-terminal-related transcriptional regulator [Tidjanibacter sp.]|nr:LuxR C-terminal-related transcriptional regulator [Tidjanibacter sp.]
MIVLLLIIILCQTVCLIILIGHSKRRLSLVKAASQPLLKPDISSCRNLLSLREKEILAMICHGLSNREIADRLSLSKRTVDHHRANILTKTASNNTAELVVFSIRSGLIDI